MFMWWVPIFAAINNANEKNREKEQEEKHIRRRVIYNLLLKGETDFMEIGLNENISVVMIYFGSNYVSNTYYKDKWFATVGTEKIVENSLTQCIRSLIQRYNAKSIQLIPRSVDADYGIVNSYTLILKYIDAENTNFEASLNNIEDKMSEEIKTAW